MYFWIRRQVHPGLTLLTRKKMFYGGGHLSQISLQTRMTIIPFCWHSAGKRLKYVHVSMAQLLVSRDVCALLKTTRHRSRRKKRRRKRRKEMFSYPNEDCCNISMMMTEDGDDDESNSDDNDEVCI